MFSYKWKQKEKEKKRSDLEYSTILAQEKFPVSLVEHILYKCI